MKRNFLGDILHTLTGVATDDQLQHQMKLDEEIRSQVMNLLHHQSATDKDMADMLDTVARGEDGLAQQLQTVQQQHMQDMNLASRLITFHSIVLSDINLLECTMSSLSTGVTPPYLSALLSVKSGLVRSAPYRFVQVSPSPKGVTVEYVGTLYRESEVLEVFPSNFSGAYFLRTRYHLFFLSSLHVANAPISELDVRYSDVFCAECAVLCHLESHFYRVLLNGTLTCYTHGRVAAPLTVAHDVVYDLSVYVGCSNRAVSFGRVNLSVQEYTTSTEDAGLDALLLNRNVKVHNVTGVQSDILRTVLSGKVHLLKELSDAKKDMNVLSKMSLDSGAQNFVHATAGAAWLTVITLICVPIFALVLYNCFRRQRAA